MNVNIALTNALGNAYQSLQSEYRSYPNLETEILDAIDAVDEPQSVKNELKQQVQEKKPLQRTNGIR